MIARLGENISYSGCSLAACWRIPCHFVHGSHVGTETRAKQSRVWQVLLCVTLCFTFGTNPPTTFPKAH